MNAAKAAAVALIAFSGVAIPTSGAVHANGDEPLLCGLLSPCEEGSDDGSGDDAEPEPVDIELDLELDLDLGIGHDGGSDADAIGDVDANAGVQLFPQHGTLLDADADVQPAVVDASVLHRTLDLESNTGVDTDAHLRHDGAVVTGSGFANAQAGADAGQKLVGVAAANQLCGVQVVVAATSAAKCQPTAPSQGGTGTSDGLMAIAESFDVCGAHVAVAGSATTSCGDRPDGATPGASSSWTLTRATVTGTACGLSVAVAGDSSTSCSNSTQMSPVPGAAPNGSGTGTPGTGATGAAGSTEPPGAGGPASSPAAGGQPAQTPTDDGTTGHDESASLAGAEVGGGSLPLTGTSVLMLLMIAAAVVAAGLVAVRTSRVRVGHQS